MKGADELMLPPGFRFHPTDDELVKHYLCRKCAAQPIAVPIIAEIDLYKFDPWELPEMVACGEKEWYFFSPRDRKYPKGSRPNRAAGSGYWKATGADKPVGRPKTLGIKKSLVVYAGKSPKGIKTNWIMHEYRLANVDRSAANNKNLRLDDWVLCRIYNKKGTIEKHYSVDRKLITHPAAEDLKPDSLLSGHSGMGYGSPILTSDSDLLHMDKPEDSMPRLHTDSSSKEHVLSPEEEVVHSEPNLSWLDNDFHLDFHMNSSMDCFQDGDPYASQGLFQVDQMQDMLSYLQRPF